MEKIKQCSDCRRFLGESSFGWRNKNNTLIKSVCKKCSRNRCILWKLGNKHNTKLYNRQYRINNLNQIKQYKKDNKGLINTNTAKRRAMKFKATPAWANQEIIAYIYKECSELNDLYEYTKFHVDHYYPLQGETVCGLHHENNLHIITAFENVSKNNKCPEKDIQLNRRI